MGVFLFQYFYSRSAGMTCEMQFWKGLMCTTLQRGDKIPAAFTIHRTCLCWFIRVEIRMEYKAGTKSVRSDLIFYGRAGKMGPLK